MANAGLGDAVWEMADPCPDVHALFLQFDARFFWQRLGSVSVRWSRRMYSCAGVCRYEGKGGMCDIALSEPLLKLRPRKDLIETLLHEMIHAFLFISNKDRDRDGHGPIFQSHMRRINKEANVNITIYHDFHDEVRLYQTHWWRCNGPCQSRKPFFGTVRRSSNRAPGPNDFWWRNHETSCGGKFIKIKEPEKKTKTASKKPKENITKYTTSNVKSLKDIPSTSKVSTAAPKGDNSNITTSPVIPKPLSNVSNQNSPKPLWPGKGNTLVPSSKLIDDNIQQTVRNHWANKSLNIPTLNALTDISKNTKRTSSDIGDFTSPPAKINKIDNYFPKSEFKTPSRKINKTFNNPNTLLSNDNVDIFPSTNRSPNGLTKEVAESMLKDIYGEDFTLYRQKKYEATPPKLVAVRTSVDSNEAIEHWPNDSNTSKDECIVAGDNVSDLVSCPICNVKVKNSEVNGHLDICLLTSTLENETTTEENDAKELIDLTYIDTKISVTCPVCNKIIHGPLDDHLDVCLAIFKNEEPFSEVATSSSTTVKKEIAESVIDLIDDDDDDIDESQEFNRTGTMYPCPCCMTMVEADLMNQHIDKCMKLVKLEGCQVSSA